MEHLDSMLRLADKELEVFEKNGKFRSREEIDTVYKLVDIVKDVYCIWDYQKSGKSYDDGSYARHRDSMGRYARDDGREEYIKQLRSLADHAPDERTRDSINRMIREME